MSRRLPDAPAGQRAWTAWLPALVWAAVIFLLSSRSTVPLPVAGHSDKLAHFAAYAVLGVLLAHGQHSTQRLSPLAVVALGLLYGASDEFHQSFVPGRTMEFADWIADALGVCAGVGAYRMWRRRRAPAPGARRRRTFSFSAHD